MEHTVRAFDQELAAIKAEVTRLGGLAEAEVSDALTALIKRDPQLAAEVVERDRKLDDLELEIEERATQLMALRQPVAIDLRRTLAALKMASNLERCGDLAKNIAKRALILGEAEPMAPLMRPIERMGRLVLRRLHDSLDAHSRDDLVLASEVWSRDREVDEHYESLFRELLTYMMGDPRTITACAHLLFVAKNLERIGDHATNIAEIVHYEITGEQLTSRPKLENLPGA
ncbi:phosphate transport system regulatory protein PhoU [Phenylobacterium hankyongense]|uniref:Phosphate-specific transport system accessory protein PhoU n=1 Tax=Phenylobacterium hankyongense TaxID=1813876 RepID=A0A328AW84_9CAUL|nr:phosphate signaling complex protein PhoU [Phenylobacterium hankyongense]RAK59243.1 phosphate transport system regulatory protein PhoU [Phenylobacterium hankyongense]